MKKLSIIVRSEKLDDVKAILDECGSTGATVSNIMGYGNQKGYKTTYRGSEYVVNLIPKIKIETIVKDPEVGDVFYGKVVRLMGFGAFVQIAPGKDGLVHISKLEKRRVERVEDVVNVGDMIWVKVIEIDDKGRINLSRKDVKEEEKVL